jgi:hypothetical protein
VNLSACIVSASGRASIAFEAINGTGEDALDPGMEPQLAKDETGNLKSASLFRIIATDIHFWIPLLVFVAGLVLLHALR